MLRVLAFILLLPPKVRETARPPIGHIGLWFCSGEEHTLLYGMILHYSYIVKWSPSPGKEILSSEGHGSSK